MIHSIYWVLVSTKKLTISHISGTDLLLVLISGGNLLRPGGGGNCFLPRLPCNDRSCSEIEEHGNFDRNDGDDGDDDARLRQDLKIILILNTNILKTVIRTKMMIRMTNCH